MTLFSFITVANAEATNAITDIVTTIRNTYNLLMFFFLFMLVVVFGFVYYIASHRTDKNENNEDTEN